MAAGFALSQVVWRDACFPVVGPKFGCGSSREHAGRGLLQLGIRAVVGTSFAGIFADNTANNGLLLVGLPGEDLAALRERAAGPARDAMTLDLPAKEVTAAGLRIGFEILLLWKDRLPRPGPNRRHAGACRRHPRLRAGRPRHQPPAGLTSARTAA